MALNPPPWILVRFLFHFTLNPKLALVPEVPAYFPELAVVLTKPPPVTKSLDLVDMVRSVVVSEQEVLLE